MQAALPDESAVDVCVAPDFRQLFLFLLFNQSFVIQQRRKWKSVNCEKTHGILLNDLRGSKVSRKGITFRNNSCAFVCPFCTKVLLVSHNKGVEKIKTSGCERTYVQK